jgi:serine/threonine protein kinase
VLLHIDESDGDLIPRPLISDFGTTRQVVYFPRDGESGRRTGNTGTLEYCAPENVELNAGRGDIGKESDHWALGALSAGLAFCPSGGHCRPLLTLLSSSTDQA